MTTKIPVELSSTPGIVDNSDATAITIDSSENVGIGNTSPSNALTVGSTSVTTSIISVVGSSSGFPQIRFSDDASESGQGRVFYDSANDGMGFSTASTERMRIDSNGNLLIGSSTSIASNIGLQVTGTNAAGFISLFRDDSSVVADDDLGGILFYGDDNSATTQFASIRATADGTHADSDNPTALRFLTTSDGAEVSAERMRIDSSGNVGIGSTPSTTIRNDIHATEKALQVGRAAMLFADSGLTTDLNNNSHLNNSDQRVAMTGTLGGSFYAQYNGVHTFYTAAAVAAGNVQSQVARYTINSSGGSNSSDIKLKENIENIPYGLDTIKSLQPRKFKWKETGDQSIGFIAQEVESLIPELISEVYDDPVRPDTSEKTKMLNYSAMASVLTKAIQELTAKVEELEGKIE